VHAKKTAQIACTLKYIGFRTQGWAEICVFLILAKICSTNLLKEICFIYRIYKTINSTLHIICTRIKETHAYTHRLTCTHTYADKRTNLLWFSAQHTLQYLQPSDHGKEAYRNIFRWWRSFWRSGVCASMNMMLLINARSSMMCKWGWGCVGFCWWVGVCVLIYGWVGGRTAGWVRDLVGGIVGCCANASRCMCVCVCVRV